MTGMQKSKCHKLIHASAASGAALAASLAQLPGADVPALVAIEIAMTVSLGAVFGIELTTAAAKSIAIGSTGTTVGRGVSQWLVGWVPGLGNAINAATATGVIEALGWAVAADFARSANS